LAAVAAQIAGGIAGAILANLMFEVPVSHRAHPAAHSCSAKRSQPSGCSAWSSPA
jgi:glycerol uptake facilitator-like aquaporin